MTTVVIRSILPGTRDVNGDRSSVGHAWIEVHHENGAVESYGFYPERTKWTNEGFVSLGDGALYIGKGLTSDPIALNDEEIAKIRLFAESTGSHGVWTLPGYGPAASYWNCATWAVAALGFAGVSRVPLKEGMAPPD